MPKMDRRRKIALWIVVPFAVLALVAPLALAFGAANDDEPDDRIAVLGNDVGRPVPVAPDGRLYAGVETGTCSVPRATIVARLTDLERPIRAVREVTGPRLFDVWAVSSEVVDQALGSVTDSIERLYIDAGTTAADALDGDDGQIVFGIGLGASGSDLYVVAIGRETDERFVFEWPCAPELTEHLANVGARVGRPADQALAIELLLGE